MPPKHPQVFYQHQLQKRRKPRQRPRAIRKPELTIPQILAWVDDFRSRSGRWPTVDSGKIGPLVEATWRALDAALRIGNRGLPGGSSLARLMADERGVRNGANLPPLRIKQILNWADLHHQQTGEWPKQTSGIISAAPSESWLAVDIALRHGLRGLRGSSSLMCLLADHRGVRHLQMLPPLSIDRILAWADAHHQHSGQWPLRTSGIIAEATGENWSAIEANLICGTRGLPGGSSLAQLLASQRGVRNRMALPPLTIAQILNWADDRHQRTGEWPKHSSGTILAAPSETWWDIQTALQNGNRGLPGHLSLARLLAAHRGVPNPNVRPKLNPKQILAWAEAHYRRTGNWPTSRAGPIEEASGETWSAVDAALIAGRRGLAGNSSLVRLLKKHHQQ